MVTMARIGRPTRKNQLPLREDIAHWQWFVKANLARVGMTTNQLAERLNLTTIGLTHRLNMRAEWPIHDLKDLAVILGLPLDLIASKYPDMRKNKNRYVEVEECSRFTLTTNGGR